jgi:hypothetical protein
VTQLLENAKENKNKDRDDDKTLMSLVPHLKNLNDGENADFRHHEKSDKYAVRSSAHTTPPYSYLFS